MNEANNDINNLSDLSKLNDTEQTITNSKPKIDSLGRSYATGRRKESTARVWVKRGTGNVTINGKKNGRLLRKTSFANAIKFCV